MTDLSEIRKAVERAKEIEKDTTNKPWHVGNIKSDNTLRVYGGNEDQFLCAPVSVIVHSCDKDLKDAAFIAESRTLLPQLADYCAELLELQEEHNEAARLAARATTKAAKLWREATGKDEHTFPDTEVLLDWLMHEIEVRGRALNGMQSRYSKILECAWAVVNAYNASPDGPLGKGFRNNHFIELERALIAMMAEETNANHTRNK